MVVRQRVKSLSSACVWWMHTATSISFVACVSSYRPPGGVGLWLDVLHRLAVASGTPQRGHAADIFPTKFGRSDRHISNGFIDEHLFTTRRAAIQVFLRRWAKRFV